MNKTPRSLPCELSVEAYSPVPISEFYKLITEQPRPSYSVRPIMEKVGADFPSLLLLKPDRSYLIEENKGAANLSKVAQFASLFVFGGPTADFIAANVSEPEKTIFTAPDLRVGRVLCQTPGVLEILLMLADVGTATKDQLVASAVDEENLLEATAELRRYDLVGIQRNTIYLTETGSIVVRKLRTLHCESKDRDG